MKKKEKWRMEHWDDYDWTSSWWARNWWNYKKRKDWRKRKKYDTNTKYQRKLFQAYNKHLARRHVRLLNRKYMIYKIQKFINNL